VRTAPPVYNSMYSIMKHQTTTVPTRQNCRRGCRPWRYLDNRLPMQTTLNIERRWTKERTTLVLVTALSMYRPMGEANETTLKVSELGNADSRTMLGPNCKLSRSTRLCTVSLDLKISRPNPRLSHFLPTTKLGSKPSLVIESKPSLHPPSPHHIFISRSLE
jgi:hypothetical protein